jgi:hypothetical protein
MTQARRGKAASPFFFAFKREGAVDQDELAEIIRRLHVP